MIQRNLLYPNLHYLNLLCSFYYLLCLVGIESVAGITVGSRCQIMPGARRGTVAFVGEIEQLKAGDNPCETL